jgi:ribosome-associated protein
MVPVNERVTLDDAEILIEAVRAGGPGGQNVNKVATAVRLRFDVSGSPSLPEDVRARLTRLAGKRLAADGFLTIQAQRHRTQERNREDAIERLAELIRQACEIPRARRPTRPTAASKRRRLDEKRQRGQTKEGRRRLDSDPG